MRSFLSYALVVAGVFVAGCTASKAQCSNAAINAAFAANHSTPSGSGTSGECNANRYGAGSWAGQADLNVRVAKARLCSEPWLGQIYWNLYNRNPTSTECSTSHYGGGSWSSYMDLASKVQAYQSAPRGVPALPVPTAVAQQQARVASQGARLQTYHVDSAGNMISPMNQMIAYAGHYWINATIVAQGGGNIVAQGGGNIVAQGGGNVMPQPGMLVNTNSSNFIVPR